MTINAYVFSQCNFVTDGNGGIVTSQVIRLIGNIYSQTMRIYICGERPVSYPSRHKLR